MFPEHRLPLRQSRRTVLILFAHEIRVWTRDLLIAIGLALVIIVFLYQPVKVEGTSMAPLLSDQERIFINKFVYRFEPIQRGDVVVFWYPLDRSKSFIKRVVGLARREGRDSPGRGLRQRRKLVAEPYVPPQYEDLSDFGPVRGSQGQLFCDGRSPHQFQRFACVWAGGQPVHLWPRRFCVLAGGSFRLAVATTEAEDEVNGNCHEHGRTH